MPAQQREARKNYIGIVNDTIEEQCAAQPRAKSDHVVKIFFVAVLAAMRNRRRKTKA